MRQCLNCESKTTGFNKTLGQDQWYRYKDGYICKKCYHKLIASPKWNPIKNPKYAKRHLGWYPTHKLILLKENPRKGVCQKCGKKIGDTYIDYDGKPAIVKRTHIHHIVYHEDDPLRDTIELCQSCHKKEHWIKVKARL